MADMWVKLPQITRFQDKTAIAKIDRRSLGNVNRSISIALLMNSPNFDEKLVRDMLSLKYRDVEKWQLHVVTYRAEDNTLDVLVSSPDFDPVPEGCASPSVGEHWCKV